ncbi:MAG TPA: PepSY-associated TM helix domain-containing protein [Sphingobacteriaceae bacterium]
MGKLFGKRIYRLHKWSGLLAGIVIFILGVSGSFLVFHEEFEAYEHRHLWTVTNDQPVDIDKAYRSIIEQYQNWEMRLQRFSGNPQETLIFSLRRPEQRLTVFVHPSNGKILKVLDSNKTIVTWVLTLHYSLHASLTGEIIVLIAGLAFLTSIITGIIVYRKAFADILLFRIKFRQKHKRSFASSLHRYIGVWALLLNIVIIVSGLLISYDIVSNAIKSSGTKAAAATTPRIHFSIDSSLNALRQRYPDFQPSYMRFPTAEGLPLRITGKVEGQAFYWSRFYNSATVDAVTGKMPALKLNMEADGKTKLASISRAIHFVEFGDLPVKILICLIGLSAPVLSITGFLLWYWKKKKPPVNTPSISRMELLRSKV